MWPKDPGDLADYVIHWSDWIRSGDAIDTHVLNPDVSGAGGVAPLIVTSSMHDDVDVTFWLDGGDDGTTYLLSCAIVTTAGREATRYAYVKVARQFAVA